MNNKRIILAHTALWAAYDGLSSLFLAAYALALGADNVIIGILGALPFLASIITQIPGADLAQHLPRTKIYAIFASIGRLIWIPILLAPFAFTEPILAVVIFYLAARICETLTDPAQTTLIADSVSAHERGQFTSLRLRIIGIFGIGAMTLGGLWLKQFPKESPIGFALMFGFAVLIGLCSSLLMLRYKEQPYPDHEKHTIKEFFTLTPELRRFVTFAVFFNFAFMLASPFFTVYMLKNLGISYEFYGIISSVTVLAQILAAKTIGKLTDRFGDKPVALLGVLGTALVPIAFLGITPEHAWLLIPAHLLSGTVWSAVNIANFNLLLDLTEPNKRALQVAEYNLYANVPLIIAPVLGGWLSEHAVLIISGIPLVFVLSSILRLLSATLLFCIKEPRAKQEYSATHVLFEAIHFHPNKGIVHGINAVKRVALGLLR